MGFIKFVTLQPLKEYDIYLCIVLAPNSICSWNSTIYLQENLSITDKISIQIKLFQNFYNKIVLLFFHHYC
jgi:hypothetical protein